MSYEELYSAFVDAHRDDKCKKACQDETNILWSEIKNKSGDDKLKREELTYLEIKRLKEIVTRKRAKFANYFIPVSFN